ncbi:MAG: glycoside hydrolase family 92 protein, partial [Bacteroidales bacterium]|nr:glycoside hydrolase family 92 protein [Bacteroidales bacterium]
MKSISRFVLAAAFAAISVVSAATPRNIAPEAKATVSDSFDDNHGADALNDGIILHDGKGEWVCKGSLTPWGVMHLPWARLDWDREVSIDRVVIYDRPALSEHLAGGVLHFSDGSR